jgi:hypothetical protein
MYNRLGHYRCANNILISEQFGFRRGLSTENAALKLTDNILRATKNTFSEGKQNPASRTL